MLEEEADTGDVVCVELNTVEKPEGLGVDEPVAETVPEVGVATVRFGISANDEKEGV